MLRTVIKRNGKEAKFMPSKIRIALDKANKSVDFSEQVTDAEIDKIVSEVKHIRLDKVHIEVIQDMVEDMLMEFKHKKLARNYIIYRYKHSLKRDLSESEISALGLLNGSNLAVVDENSNKNSYANSTQRDLMAGEMSRAMTKKLRLPDDIRLADERMEIHWHDIDYSIQQMINCFGRETKFLTTSGVRSFEDFNDGDIVEVFSHTGVKRKAVVHNYGRQKLYNITFKRGKNSFRTIRATRNHRWLLLNGNQTTNLSVGDSIITPPIIDSFNLADYCRQPYKCYSIEEDIEEDVWCLEVEEDKSFILEGGLVTGNCCLINIKSILDYGTVMQGILIESPRSFRVACNVMAQVVANIASNQYGGQSIAIKHLGKYLKISEERFFIEEAKSLDKVGIKYTQEQLKGIVADKLKYELKQGVQNIQYSILCLMTTCGFRFVSCLKVA